MKLRICSASCETLSDAIEFAHQYWAQERDADSPTKSKVLMTPVIPRDHLVDVPLDEDTLWVEARDLIWPNYYMIQRPPQERE
jgi:hypothetical protein